MSDYTIEVDAPVYKVKECTPSEIYQIIEEKHWERNMIIDCLSPNTSAIILYVSKNLNTEGQREIEFNTQNNLDIFLNTYYPDFNFQNQSLYIFIDNIEEEIYFIDHSLPHNANILFFIINSNFINYIPEVTIKAYQNSKVKSWGENILYKGYNNSKCVLKHCGRAMLYDSAFGDISGDFNVELYDNTTARTFNYCDIWAKHNSKIIAYDTCRVSSWDNVIVKAYNNVQVIPNVNINKIYLYDNAEMTITHPTIADGIYAYDYSKIFRYGKLLDENVQKLPMEDIHLYNDAKIIDPINNSVLDFLNKHNIKIENDKVILYKAVHKQGDTYVADYDNSTEYEIGKTYKIKVNIDRIFECGEGYHVAIFDWAYNFGFAWDDLAILEVEVPLITLVLPYYSHGKLRTPKMTILREIPPEEYTELM